MQYFTFATIYISIYISFIKKLKEKLGSLLYLTFTRRGKFQYKILFQPLLHFRRGRLFEHVEVENGKTNNVLIPVMSKRCSSIMAPNDYSKPQDTRLKSQEQSSCFEHFLWRRVLGVGMCGVEDSWFRLSWVF